MKSLDKIVIEQLETFDFAQLSQKISISTPEDDSLVDGKLGRVLYNIVQYEYTDNEQDYIQAIKGLQEVIGGIGKENGLRVSSSLAKGLSGLGLVILLLQQNEYLAVSDELNHLLSRLSKVIYEQCKKGIESRDLDPLHSSMGGIYFLSQRAKTNKEASLFLTELLHLLNHVTDQSAYGPVIKNLRYNKTTPKKIQIGLAHGVCGMILILLETQNILKDSQSYSLLHRLLTFFIKIYTPFTKGKDSLMFPRYLNDDGEKIYLKLSENYDMGWCFSDASVAYSFLKAGTSLNNEAWKAFGTILLDNFLQFDPEKLPIRESTFCHGTSGLAWLLYKCYLLTQDRTHLDASQYWEKRSRKLLPSELNRSQNFGLLDGLSGTSLVLMSLSGKVKFNWDHVFFL